MQIHNKLNASSDGAETVELTETTETYYTLAGISDETKFYRNKLIDYTNTGVVHIAYKSNRSYRSIRIKQRLLPGIEYLN